MKDTFEFIFWLTTIYITIRVAFRIKTGKW